MAIRQYIGARYVPKIEGNWVASTSYEALTIVTYNHASYTSKKAVPATVGNPADNPEYWALTGDYNAQVAQYAQDVNDYHQDVIQVQEDMSDLETEVDQKIANINHKVYLLVSDSYGNAPTAVQSWQHKFKDYLGLSDSECYIAYKSGYGFAPSGYNAPFIDLITPGTVDTGVPADIPTNTITDIIVGGGFNDRNTSVADIEAAISAFCTYAKATYPNAKIHIAPIGWSFNSEFIGEIFHNRYISAYNNCSKYGANRLIGTEFIMHDKDLFMEETSSHSLLLIKQYVHPNEAGAAALAAGIINSLNGGCSVNYLHKYETFTVADNITIQFNLPIAVMLNNGLITLHWGKGNISHTDHTTFSLGNTDWTKVEIGTITGGYFNTETTTWLPCEMFLAGGSYTSNVRTGGYLIVENGKIYAAVASSQGNETCTNIWIHSGMATIDATW